MTEPLRVKYLGFFYLTKRTYVILQVLVFLLAFALIAYLWNLPESPRFGLDLNNPNMPAPTKWLFSHALEIVIFGTVLEVFDAIFMLWAFARKERAMQQSKADNP